MTDLATLLGHPAGTRVLIPHVDDVGVCQGANLAFVELAEKGFVTTGSVMVPCAWFPEIVALAQQQPALDLGVHLTLTSESRACRWRPISTTAKVSGLIDGDGYMWPDVPALRRHAHKGAVEAECRAQIEAALAAGLDVTHLDTHMGAAAAPEFVDRYLALGREYRLPVLLPRESWTYSPVLDMGPLDPDLDRRLIAELEGQGMPLIDRFAMGIARRDEPAELVWRQLIDDAPPGVTFLSLHCNAPGEVERLHPNDAAFRIAEYQLFQDPGFLELDRRAGGRGHRLSRDPRGLAQLARRGLSADRSCRAAMRSARWRQRSASLYSRARASLRPNHPESPRCRPQPSANRRLLPRPQHYPRSAWASAWARSRSRCSRSWTRRSSG